MSRRPAQPANLEKLKRQSVGQLLLKCARLFNERALERLNQTGSHGAIKASHTNLFPHLDFKGIRLTELAHRLGVTKQAVGQNVADLEAQGVVETVPDPTDARAKLVRFTEAGARAIEAGLKTLGQVEEELTPRVGRERMLALHDALLALECALTEESDP